MNDARHQKVSQSSDPEELNTPTTMCVKSCNFPTSVCPLTWPNAEVCCKGVQKCSVLLPSPFRTGKQARKGFEWMLSGPVYRIWKLNKCSWINEWVQSDFICSLVVPDLHSNIPWDSPLTHHMLTLVLPPHDYSSLKSITHRLQSLGPFSSNSRERERVSTGWSGSWFFLDQVFTSASICFSLQSFKW